MIKKSPRPWYSRGHGRRLSFMLLLGPDGVVENFRRQRSGERGGGQGEEKLSTTCSLRVRGPSGETRGESGRSARQVGWKNGVSRGPT